MYTVPKSIDFSPEQLDKLFAEVRSAFDQEVESLATNADVKPFLNRWFARNTGVLAQVGAWLQAAPKESKKEIGSRLKSLQEFVAPTAEVHRASAQRDVQLDEIPGHRNFVLAAEPGSYVISGSNAKLQKTDRVDITLPGIRRPLGAEHPVIRTMNEMVNIFKRMGYSVGVGPEIETDYYNFEALNFPPNHPARDTQDTIFISGQEQKAQRDKLLLRTHTSPVQIRTMEKQKPPVRIVIPGKVHRNDAADATHSPVFHQIEGLCVDTNITFCDLKGTLDHAMKAFFGSKVKTRFFPSFFPFTEPSADVAISCFKCGGTGKLNDGPCRLCKTSGWVELLGSGMVDPNVYGFVDYDPAKVSGFAFGMGVERLAMALYDIDDIQLLFQGDVRFLEQFA